MTLTNLIQELKEATESKKIPRQEVGKLIDGRIEVPEDFNISHGSIEFTDMNFGSRGDAPLYHLLVSGFPKRTLDNVQPVLDEIFSRARNLRLDKGTADIKYAVLWTPERFQQERKLTGLFFDEVEIESRAYTCDPTKVRIGMQGHSHEIEATTQRNKMILKATGKYREQLEGLVERYNPQVAKLNLSKDDAERLLKKVKNNPVSKYVAGRLEKALQPEERSVMSLSLGGGMSFGTQEVIGINILTKFLQQYTDDIGKPLVEVPPKQESQVTEFMKWYNIIELLKGQRLNDLQTLAREIPQMDLGIIYGHPMLTNESARELLDKEIEYVEKIYKDPMFQVFTLGMISPGGPFRRGLLNRLVEDYFGKEEFEKLTSVLDEEGDNFINLLRQRGYMPVNFEDSQDDKTYSFSNWKNERFKEARKERHLLEFFKQSYVKDPKESIQRFREYYQNTAPKMRIFARSRSKDASKLRKLKLPDESRLYEFGITEYIRGKYSNNLSITRTLPSSDDIHFFSRTSIDSPILLPLQEYACKEVGIKFS